VGAIAAASFIAYRLGPGNQPSSALASPQDVRFVLNWCHLGESRIEEVLHSYKSARSLTGDHLDAYAIRISHVDISELKKDQDAFGQRWQRGDQAQGVVNNAIEFVTGWLDRDAISWFLTPEDIRSDQIYIFPWSTTFLGTRATSAQLIFIRPKDKMIFYISCKL